MHIQPAPEISQHQTAAAEPPADRGYEKVVMMVENKPLMLTAKEKVERYPNSLLKTGLYPNSEASWASASLISSRFRTCLCPFGPVISTSPTLLWRCRTSPRAGAVPLALARVAMMIVIFLRENRAGLVASGYGGRGSARTEWRDRAIEMDVNS